MRLLLTSERPFARLGRRVTPTRSEFRERYGTDARPIQASSRSKRSSRPSTAPVGSVCQTVRVASV